VHFAGRDIGSALMPVHMTALPSYSFSARRQAYFSARSQNPKKTPYFSIADTAHRDVVSEASPCLQ